MDYANRAGLSDSDDKSKQELFQVKEKPAFDTNTPMNEYSKAAWLSSVLGVPVVMANSMTTGSSKTSTKTPKQIQVSQKSAAGTSQFETTGSASSKAIKSTSSKDNGDYVEISGGSSRPRRNSLDNDNFIGIAAAEREIHNNASSSKKRSSSTKEDVIPSGRSSKNSALTKDAIARINQVNPIEAWEKQHQNEESASAATESRKKSSFASGIAAITSSSKYQLFSGTGAGASSKVKPRFGESSKSAALVNASTKTSIATGEASAKSGKNKHYSTVEVFDASGFSGKHYCR